MYMCCGLERLGAVFRLPVSYMSYGLERLTSCFQIARIICYVLWARAALSCFQIARLMIYFFMG